MLNAGTAAPDFTLQDQNGISRSLSDYREQRVILYFYSKDMTSGCTKQACGFAELYPQFTEKGAVVIGISRDSVLAKCKSLDMDKDSYSFTYSNYGYAVLGLVLEAVYGKDYTSLLNEFVRNELGMGATKISERDGDLDHYWDWQENDAYLSAGAVTSNIEDMLRYAQLQLDESPIFSRCHKSLKTINASSDSYKLMGIHMDEIGMAWIMDKENGFIWHNGGTGHYNSYLGFSPENRTAVVILSNLAPNDRIPATVLGIKKLLELKQ